MGEAEQTRHGAYVSPYKQHPSEMNAARPAHHVYCVPIRGLLRVATVSRITAVNCDDDSRVYYCSRGYLLPAGHWQFEVVATGYKFNSLVIALPTTAY